MAEVRTQIADEAPTRQQDTTSLAIAQRSLRDPAITYPLWPPLTDGCPRTSTPEIQYPVDVAFDLDHVDRLAFGVPDAPDIRHWSPLLPPLVPKLDLGVGRTPLLEVPDLAKYAGLDRDELYIKDETRNPTWSHKDRLNLVTTSAALLTDAPGIVVASSGNHGASAAAFAAAAGLPCVVVTSTGSPPAVTRFLLSYGAAVVGVPVEMRWPVVRQIVERLGYHPVSNLTRTHTGHGFGPEGYKTIAFETYVQLGHRVPSAMFVPTGYGEMLFGIYKGFDELRELGITSVMPRLFACEPAARAPLARALAEGKDAIEVERKHTVADAIASPVSGYRGVLAVRGSHGKATPVSDERILDAHRQMARSGFWHEVSSAAGLASLRHEIQHGGAFEGPVVFVSTSCGFKSMDLDDRPLPAVDGSWAAVSAELRAQGIALT
jgi:threonine synthase